MSKKAEKNELKQILIDELEAKKQQIQTISSIKEKAQVFDVISRIDKKIDQINKGKNFDKCIILVDKILTFDEIKKIISSASSLDDLDKISIVKSKVRCLEESSEPDSIHKETSYIFYGDVFSTDDIRITKRSNLDEYLEEESIKKAIETNAKIRAVIETKFEYIEKDGQLNVKIKNLKNREGKYYQSSDFNDMDEADKMAYVFIQRIPYNNYDVDTSTFDDFSKEDEIESKSKRSIRRR